MKSVSCRNLAFILCVLPLCSLGLIAQESFPTQSLNSGRPHFRFNSTLREDGKPVTGVHFLTFSVYASEDRQGGPLWSETIPVEADVRGRYTVYLGTHTPTGFVEQVRKSHPLLWITRDTPDSSGARAQVITTIPQGIYQDCNLDGLGCSGPAGDTATSQLSKIAAANFYVVLNYSSFWGSKQQVLDYAAYASNVGLNIIWNFSDPAFAKYSGRTGKFLINDYAELSASCGCTTNKGFIQYVVNLVKNLPATYGYSIGDEPVTNTSANVKSLYNIIHTADVNHPQFVNATWDDANNPSLTNLQQHLNPFNFADELGGDYYPIGTGAPASYTATAAGDVNTVATTYGKTPFFVAQAFNWAQYDPSVCPGTCTYPTTSQLQTILTDAATYAKPEVILWYTYYDTVNAGQWSNFVATVNPQHP